jgi:hypothetical protein
MKRLLPILCQCCPGDWLRLLMVWRVIVALIVVVVLHQPGSAIPSTTSKLTLPKTHIIYHNSTMSMSDSSSLSSAPSTEDEAVAKSVNRSIGLEKYFKPKPKTAPKNVSPPPPKRPASPPHEYVLADNPDIAVSHSWLCIEYCRTPWARFNTRLNCD